MAGFGQRTFWRLWNDKFFLFVVAANTAQFLGRLGFAIAGLDGGIDRFLDGPAPAWTVVTMHVMFFSLGIAGVPATLGFALRGTWGTRAVILVSAATVAFDIWGFTLQPSAALGFVVPAVSLAYLGIMDRMSRSAPMRAPLANS